jgi:hypothetical protein
VVAVDQRRHITASILEDSDVACEMVTVSITLHRKRRPCYTECFWNSGMIPARGSKVVEGLGYRLFAELAPRSGEVTGRYRW